eukprot:COSAG04_NODE_5970_length_1446_cov_1.293244_2_plen_53_part_00
MLMEYAMKSMAFQELNVEQDQQQLEELQTLLSQQAELEASAPLVGRKVSLGA